MQVDETSTPPKRSKKTLKTVLVVLLTLFLGLWFFSPSGALEQPLHLQRGEDGLLHPADGNSEGLGPNVRARAGVIKASNSRSASSSSNHSDPGWFQAKSLVVMNRSDHLLMKRAGKALLDELSKHHQWENVVYLPYGFELDSGTPASDIYMTISLESIEESGILGRELKAVVKATVGTSIIASHHSVQDSLSPPTVSFNARVELQHQSTMTGVESAGAKYSLQGANIATELVAALNDQVDGLNLKFSPPPEVIKEFLAPYRPVPEFPFLDDLKVTQIASIHGTMIHNDTLWSTEPISDDEALIEKISGHLQEQGWKEHSKELASHTTYLRMKNGSKWFEVFPQDSSLHTPHDENSDGSRVFYMRYRDRMTTGELQAIYGKLLETESPDIELLLALNNFASHQQREQMFALAETHSPTSPNGWVRIANWYAANSKQEKFITALKKANVFSLFIQDRSDISRRITDLIKKHKLDKDEVLAIDTSILEEAGLQRLTMENPQVIKEFQVGTPVAFYVPSDDPAKWSYVAASVEQAGQNDYRLTYYEGNQQSSNGRSSICCIALDHPRRHPFMLNKPSVEIQITKLSDGRLQAQARLIVDSEPDASEGVTTK